MHVYKGKGIFEFNEQRSMEAVQRSVFLSLCSVSLMIYNYMARFMHGRNKRIEASFHCSGEFRSREISFILI